MGLAKGQSISGYTILGSLGVGGMGEVYRARDTRLGREVAIKVLPSDWRADEQHAARFEREARTLASLNHPNVAQVYAFEEVDGVRLLVLELVEGEDLAERIARGPLSLRETVELCTQVAKGLEAAHELGVVHRDLKPANVRVTPGDRAKVLDFGLAKATTTAYDSAEARTRARGSSFETQDGTLLGTPAYMSPEQVRARRVDRRADIWAFGCVLYECLTGKPPFAAESLADTLAAIVKSEPDLSKLPRDTPQHLRTLISRCLDKDSRTRLRDIGEARITLSGDMPETPLPTPTAAVPRRTAGTGVLLVALAAVIGAVIIAREALAPGVPTNPLDGAKITKITDSRWTEFAATISRKGDFVAFASDRDGPFDLWVHHIGEWTDRNLTQGSKETWGLRVQDLVFHPDGTRAVITAAMTRSPRSFSLMSDDEKEIFSAGAHEQRWSPDGSRVVYHTHEDGDPMYVADADGSNPIDLVTHDSGLHQHFPIWSPDGKWIYMVRGRPATRQMDLWRVQPSAGGKQEQLTSDQVGVMFPAPIDETTVLFVAHDPNGAGPWLWSLDVESGFPPQRLHWGVEQYTSLAASKDGRRVVATVANRRASLWRVPIAEPGATARERDIERVQGLEAVPALGPRFAGDSLYFVSSRGTGDGLWCRRGLRVIEVLAGDETAVLAPPAVSPDGESLAVVLRTKGRVRLWLVGADGQQPEALSDETNVYGSPAWSPDGTQIAVGGVDASGPGLFVFPRAGGAPKRLVDGFASNPVWSPTDDLIVYLGKSLMAFHHLRGVRPSDGSPFDLPEIRVIVAGERHRFLPDGSRLVYMKGFQLGLDFWQLDLATKEEHRLTQLDAPSEMQSFDIDPTGEYIVFDRMEQNSDVVLIELPERD